MYIHVADHTIPSCRLQTDAIVPRVDVTVCDNLSVNNINDAILQMETNKLSEKKVYRAQLTMLSQTTFCEDSGSMPSLLGLQNQDIIKPQHLHK